MAKVRHIQNAFTSGELSPNMLGRADLGRYNQGALKLENFSVGRQGGVFKRSGFRFVQETYDSDAAASGWEDSNARLIPFMYSSTEQYVLEMQDQRIRFYKNGGIITNGGTPIAKNSGTDLDANRLPQLKYAQSADILYLCHPNVRTKTISRTGSDDTDVANWLIQDFNFRDGPYLEVNTTTDVFMEIAASGSSVIEIDSSSLTGTFVVGETITGSVSGDTGTLALVREDQGLMYLHSVTGPFSASDSLDGASASVDADSTASTAGDFDILLSDSGGSTLSMPYDGAPNGGAGFVYDDYERQIRISNPATGEDWGYVEILCRISASRVTVAARSPLARTTPGTLTLDWRMGAWGHSCGWPRVCAFHGGRFWFASTDGGSELADARPQTIWGSVLGDFNRFSPTSLSPGAEISDLDGVTFTIDADEVNEIHHLISDNRGLIVFCSGAEFTLAASDPFEAITPTNVVVNRQSTYGCRPLARPMKINDATLFANYPGERVREFKFRFEQDQFAARDLTILSDHILEAYRALTPSLGVKETAMQRDPQVVGWWLRNDGQLAGITYEPEEEIVGWFRVKPGKGKYAADERGWYFRSIACIQNGNGDGQLWAIIRCYIGGVAKDYVCYMERPFTHTFDPEDAFFVDMGLTFDSRVSGQQPAQTLSGLDHLEGEEVVCLVNGKTVETHTVSSGEITLVTSAETAQVGIRYGATLESMPLAPQISPTNPFLETIRSYYMKARLWRTWGLKIGMGVESPSSLPDRSSELFGETVNMFTGVKQIDIPGDSGPDSRWQIYHDMPTPCNILATSIACDYGESP